MSDTDGVLRHVEEQTALLTGPDVCEPVATRVVRLAGLADDLLGADQETGGRMAAAALAWTAETVGAFQRMPQEFAASRPLEDERTELLHLVDAMDHLSLLLARAYSAATAGRQQTLAEQADLVDEHFRADTLLDEAGPGTIAPDDLDREHVEAAGLEVGDDGIPRLPIPEPPRSVDDAAETPQPSEGQHP